MPLREPIHGTREDLSLPVELLRSDFIVSMPKLKTHHWAGMTASMKNFFGVVPGAVYGWPKNILHVHGIDKSILDLNATIRPHLAIVDAVTAMEGDGPIMGAPRPLGLIAMGRDPCAVDATCARVIGIDPIGSRISRKRESSSGTQTSPESTTEASPGPFRHEVRGCRFLQVHPPGQELIAVGPSLEVASGADHCVGPARTPLATTYRIGRSPADLRGSGPPPPASSLRLPL